MEPLSHQGVRTTENSINILKTIRDLDGASVSQLEEELNMSTSALYKHIRTLNEYGLIQKIGDEYQLGFELFHLGEYTRRSVLNKPTIDRIVSNIHDQADEIAEFGVESNGLLVVYSASSSYKGSIPYSSDAYGPNGFHSDTQSNTDEQIDYVGNKAYMHTNAMGKALLAEKSDKEIQEIVEQYGLPQQTEKTITSTEELFDEIDSIRKRGFATTVNEWTNGLKEVAMSVEVVNNQKIGAINVCGPSFAISDDDLYDKYPKILREAKGTLEEELSE